MTSDEIRNLLFASLDEPARTWLEGALADIARDPAAIRKAFPAAGRNLGRAELLDPGADPAPWTADDAGRCLMLVALADNAGEELPGLYRFGDADEQRAIVRSLHLIPFAGGSLDLVRDAARTNDPRLVRVALGPYGLEHLEDEEVAQIALKCVFYEVPLSCIDGLADRATTGLSRMLASFALERVAAGRKVPSDIWPFVDLFPPDDLLEAIETEAHHEVAERRASAEAALSDRRAGLTVVS
jgi:hypothetical protein